ncbi:MAG: 1-deoxy-D-xylulose-5-phosphate reductoisomerase [bacterium]|nr:1-deoxy-D-xylulose-5-phosphate reductoisomerase [bacterium]
MIPKRIIVLGSTGSIGVSTLDVARNNPERLKVVGLSAGSNRDLLIRQIEEFNPEGVAIRDPSAAKLIQASYPKITVFCGDMASTALVQGIAASLAVAAISGMAGLWPILAAVDKGMNIALANKEALVAGGALLIEAAKQNNIKILPIDSEHSAIWQALMGWDHSYVKKLVLTASGGPFFGKSRHELEKITASEALRHPTWKMGSKISIDSATLMNKGLEVIEAHHLFDISYDKIEVIIHPQSVVHSIVEYIDGSNVCQFSQPDMRIPIQLALSYPERWGGNWVKGDLAGSTWSFSTPDVSTFRCLILAYEAGRRGGVFPVILNAVNEVAVSAFLRGEITFFDIERLVEEVLNLHPPVTGKSLEEIFEVDSWARISAQTIMQCKVV